MGGAIHGIKLNEMITHYIQHGVLHSTHVHNAYNVDEWKQYKSTEKSVSEIVTVVDAQIQ